MWQELIRPLILLEYVPITVVWNAIGPADGQILVYEQAISAPITAFLTRLRTR